MNSTKKALFIGGGISGLCGARTARDMGFTPLLLEQCPSLGGLSRTIEVGEFCFDYTGHFLHLSRYKTPADIPHAALDNDDWQTVNRRSCCFVAGRMIEAPIQYHLGQLPPDALAECVRSYDARPGVTGSETVTFRDYIINGFGQYLADLFLIPQNEKTQATTLDRLSFKAVKRFFPPPIESLVRAGMASTKAPAAEYNSSFWYPKSGGIGRLARGLSAGLDGVRTGQQAVAVDLGARRVLTKTGETHAWDALFPSMPLKSLCQISNDAEVRAAGEELSHSSTISFNIGLKVPLRPDLEGIHWIYVPDRAIPFYRVGFYSNISQGTCTPGTSSLYVEVGVASGDPQSPNLIRTLQPQVITALEELGWLNSRDISCVVVHVIEHAYVHFTEPTERLVRDLLSHFNGCGVYPVGRYGLWDYVGMEDSMESAMSTVREVLA